MVFSDTGHEISAVVFRFAIIHAILFPVVSTGTPLLGGDDVHVDGALLPLFFDDDCTAKLALEDNLKSVFFRGGCSFGEAGNNLVFILIFFVKEFAIIFQRINNILEEYLRNII